MTGSTAPDFIFIDDDTVTLKMYHRVVQKTVPQANIHTFADPLQGLAHINSVYGAASGENAVLFLDINMPGMDGWEVLDMIRNSSDEVGRRVRIFMLSSSIDTRDKLRSEADAMVHAFVSKPFATHDLQGVLSKYYGMTFS